MVEIATPSLEGLKEELSVRAYWASRFERITKWSGYALVAGSIIISFSAYIVSIRPGATASTVGILAALAGLATTINTVFNFEGRAAWHCRRKNAYRRLTRELLFPVSGQADLPAIASAISDLQESLSADFPRMEKASFSPAQTKFSN